jgi:ATP-dependent Lon protease
MANQDFDFEIEKIIGESHEEIPIPATLPLLPVRDTVIFANMILPLIVAREGSIQAVERAVAQERLIFLVAQKDQTVEEPQPADLYTVGSVGLVLRMMKLNDGRLKILVQGITRARITEFLEQRPWLRVGLEPVPDLELGRPPVETEALMRNVREQSEKILSLKGLLSQDIIAILNSVDEPGLLADLVASNLRLRIDEFQVLLEQIDPFERLQKVNEHLGKEVEVSTVQARIQSEAKEEMSRSQRDYYLREQLRAIRRELGEYEERSQELAEYRDKIKARHLPAEVREEALKQVSRLEQMHPDSAETSMVRTYLDWIVELPWDKKTRDKLEVKTAAGILDEDHYDLKKVKERILEYLSVRKLNPRMKGPILCFVGPPGVGKTSLGRSIARALGRKFLRISLGGVRDEAEIRGHRRTYIGALPGRILQGLKRVGVNNPVFMMDEIDKLGADYRGNPGAALLEVLDPEQNCAFSDHYLSLPFDLSAVMFITTANLADPIPSALRDRLEIIEIAGYSAEEKLEIARAYLWPRQVRDHGLKPEQLSVTRETLLQIIEEYTEEAGLRGLEKEIGALCRKIARKVAEGEKGPFRITRNNLHRYLGAPPFLPDEIRKTNEIGVATGLAWTSAGGEVLYVETTVMKGKGNFLLTGQLGEVMKESGQAALSYARSRSRQYHLKETDFDRWDIHIHVPAGAIPKDGPSAGITMAVSLLSALTGAPVDKDVAFTGEITLRGKILPVGGLKEKTLAAIRAKIKTILVPEQNRKDLEELPRSIRRRIQLVPVRDMDQVMAKALIRPAVRPAKKTAPGKGQP